MVLAFIVCLAIHVPQVAWVMPRASVAATACACAPPEGARALMGEQNSVEEEKMLLCSEPFPITTFHIQLSLNCIYHLR